MSPARTARCCGEVAGCAASGAALALMPKCPLCFAAYGAVLSGIGLSAGAARWIQALLVLVFAASLALLAWRLIRAVSRRPQPADGAAA